MYTADKRPLPYPLQYPLTIVANTEISPEIVYQTLEGLFPSDPDERTDIVISLSLNEYIVLANTIDVGRDIAYGTDSIQVWNLWVRILTMVDYCAIVADCIETSQGVQDALSGYIQSRPTNQIPDLNERLDDPINESGCDADVVFGQVSAVWDVINQTTIDFLEILVAASTPAEALSEVIAAIPVIGSLPFDEMIGFVNMFAEWTLEFYNASLTLALENSIKCDLFCLALEAEGCILSANDIMEYFAAKISFLAQVRVTTLEDMIQFIIDLPKNVADLYVYSMSLCQMYIVSLIERFLNINTINVYISFARLGDPADDWEAICDECAWSYTFEGTNLGDWYVPDSGGSFNGTIWSSTTVASSRRLHLQIDFAESTILSVEVTFVAQGTAGGRAINYPALPSASNTLYGTLSTSAGSHTDLIENTVLTTGFGMAIDSTGTGTQNTLSKIVISGIGNNPFV